MLFNVLLVMFGIYLGQEYPTIPSMKYVFNQFVFLIQKKDEFFNETETETEGETEAEASAQAQADVEDEADVIEVVNEADVIEVVNEQSENKDEWKWW